MSHNLWLQIHMMSCFYMTGVIFITQFVHYPSFRHISHEAFQFFHKGHTFHLGWIAGPAMVVELLSAIWLAHTFTNLWFINLLSVVVLWLTTFLLSVPQHNQLRFGFDQNAWKKLVWTNWFRTSIWGLRTVGFLYLTCCHFEVV